MTSFDTFVDHDLLPATTSYATLSVEVRRLRARIGALEAEANQRELDHRAEMHERMSWQDVAVRDREAWKAEAHRFKAERDAALSDRDAARQALRDLVDATSWYGDRESGHIAVSEGAMDVAMGLVVEWSQEGNSS